MKNIKNMNRFLNELMSEPEPIDPDASLKILYDIYNYQSINWRTLGAMEGLLLSLGVLNPGRSFDYKEVKKKVFGLIPIKDKETYKEYIIRKVEEYLETRYGGDYGGGFEKRKF